MSHDYFKKEIVLPVKGFQFLSSGNYFIYIPFNPITLKFNKKVFISFHKVL